MFFTGTEKDSCQLAKSLNIFSPPKKFLKLVGWIRDPGKKIIPDSDKKNLYRIRIQG